VIDLKRARYHQLCNELDALGPELRRYDSMLRRARGGRRSPDFGRPRVSRGTRPGSLGSTLRRARRGPTRESSRQLS